VHITGLSDIVSDYIQRYQESQERELRFFRVQRSLSDAVRKAALAEGPLGKRLRHQRRIPKKVLAAAARSLETAIPALEAAASFEDLHKAVREAIGGLKGVGELTLYDTALRIAAWRALEPARVFLHAGTRIGARELGLDVKAGSVSPTDLPLPLRQLRPREIEDVLCIYKRELANLRQLPS
jgi:hypothetical protein